MWYFDAVLGCSIRRLDVAKRISVINFKGGVGKTTLSFHLATGLARFHGGKEV